MNCEKKNLFSCFFYALAIQLNQRIFFVQDSISYVKFLKKMTYSVLKFNILFITLEK
jgi:hypothetical protein